MPTTLAENSLILLCHRMTHRRCARRNHARQDLWRVKDEAQQASGVVFRARDVLVRQRTQCINALRGHLTEYGYVVSKGATHVPTLIDQIEDPNCTLPESARAVLKVLTTTLTSLEENIAALDVEINRRSRGFYRSPTADDTGRRPDHGHGDRCTRVAGRELGLLECWHANRECW